MERKAAKNDSKPTAADVRSGDSRLRRVAWWALVGCVAFVPLTLVNLGVVGIDHVPLMSDPFSLGKLIALRVLTLLCLAAWAADLLINGGRVRWTRVEWVLLAFLGWATIATVTSIHPWTALLGKYHRDEGLLSFFNYALVYFLAMQLVEDSKRAARLGQALFASSLVVAGYGTIQYFGLDPVPWNVDFGAQRAFSTYGNPDILGGFLMFSLPVALSLALAERDARLRAVYFAGFFLNLFTLLVSFTRGAWVGGLIGLIVFGVIAWRNGARLTKVDLVSTGVAGLAVAAVLAAQRLPGSQADFEITEFGASRLTADVGGVHARLMIWGAAVKAIRDRPLVGFGPDTFRYVFPLRKPAEYVQRVSDNVADSPHSYPLQVAAGSGVVGALLLYAVFALVAVRSAPIVFARGGHPNRLVLGGFWAGCTGYLANSMFGLSIPGATFLLWVAMGILAAPTSRVVRVSASRWSTVAAAAVASVSLAGVLAQVPIAAADHAYVKASASSGGPEAIEAAERAIRLNPYNQAYREQLGLNHLNEALRYANAAAQAREQGADVAPLLDEVGVHLEAGERAIRDAIEFVPADYANYQYLAALYNLKGDLDDDPDSYREAIETARAGIALDPYAVAIRIELAYGLHALGDTQLAEDELRESLTIRPGHDVLSLRLASLLEEQGRVAEAIKVLREADEAEPGTQAIQDALERLESGQGRSE